MILPNTENKWIVQDLASLPLAQYNTIMERLDRLQERDVERMPLPKETPQTALTHAIEQGLITPPEFTEEDKKNDMKWRNYAKQHPEIYGGN
jgi:hypothetical protein